MTFLIICFNGTALHVACINGNSEIIQLLLSREDIDVNSTFVFKIIFLNDISNLVFFNYILI